MHMLEMSVKRLNKIEKAIPELLEVGRMMIFSHSIPSYKVETCKSRNETCSFLDFRETFLPYSNNGLLQVEN